MGSTICMANFLCESDRSRQIQTQITGLFMSVSCILGGGDGSLQSGRGGIETPQFLEVLDLGVDQIFCIIHADVQISFRWILTAVNFLGETTYQIFDKVLTWNKATPSKLTYYHDARMGISLFRLQTPSLSLREVKQRNSVQPRNCAISRMTYRGSDY